MRTPNPLLVAVAALAFLVGLTAAAFGQDTTVTLEDLMEPWLQTILALAVTILTALGGWLSMWIKRKTNLEIEFLHRDTFQTALDNAAGFLRSQTRGVSVDLRHPQLRESVLMVNKGARDAVDYYRKKQGLSDDDIAKRVLAKLGLIEEPVTHDPDT